MKKRRVFKTEDNTILIVAVENGEDWSITAEEVEPVSDKEGQERQYDYFDSGDFEYQWREAVHAGETLYGYEDWKECIRVNETWQDTLDCSLYPETHFIDGVYYSYVSGSCGCMHDEIFKYWPEAKVFIDAHLSTESLAAHKAFNMLESDDVDARVIELTREIVAE